MATTSKERKSLCEESMLIILNLLKFSSLSLARTTLTTTVASSSSSHPPPRSSSKAHRAPERGPKKLSYVMLSPTTTTTTSSPSSAVVVHRRGKIDGGDGRFEEYIRRFHEKTEDEVQNAIVEGRASDYIKRFHEKNIKDSNNESKRLSYVVLPPHLHLSPPYE